MVESRSPQGLSSRGLWQVEAYLAVAELGSVRAAAEYLDKSASAVTSAIQSLETDLLGERGRLFDRRAGGMELTDAGRALLEAATSLRASARTLRVEADAVRDDVAVITVATMRGAWWQLLDAAAARLSPPVTIDVKPIGSFWPTRLLFSGDVDFVLLPAPSDHDAKLRRTPVFAEARCVSTSSSSSIAHLSSAPLDVIDAEVWMGSPPDADSAFNDAHRCGDIRPASRRAKIGASIEDPFEIGQAVRRGEIIIGSSASITQMFAGVIDGITDVLIEDAPPWSVDLACLSRPRRKPPVGFEELAAAIAEVAPRFVRG